MKLEKTKVGGNYLKLNGKVIKSIGWFAYDGCHKIYVLESKKDLDNAMKFYYRIYPIDEIQTTYEKSCPLKFVESWDLSTYYVKQFGKAVWGTVKPKKTTKKEA